MKSRIIFDNWREEEGRTPMIIPLNIVTTYPVRWTKYNVLRDFSGCGLKMFVSIMNGFFILVPQQKQVTHLIMQDILEKALKLLLYVRYGTMDGK